MHYRNDLICKNRTNKPPIPSAPAGIFLSKARKFIAPLFISLYAAASHGTEIKEHSEEQPRKSHQVVDYGMHPRILADAEVILTPYFDYALHHGSREDIPIHGKITPIKQQAIAEIKIVFPEKSIIRSLQKGVPARVYLKKYPDREAYYPIGIFYNLKSGEEK